jgi:PAS domain S-box-containing protein
LLLGAERAALVEVSGHSGPAGPIEYGIRGTPEAEAVREGRAVVRRGSPVYLGRDWLPGVGVRAFIAVALTSSSGETIGLLGLVSGAPLANAQQLADLLQGLAPRVASELERSQQGAAILHSDARLRLLADSSHDILFYREVVSGRLRYVSPMVLDITGFPPEAFLADPELYLEITLEEDREPLRRWMASDKPEKITARIRDRGGSIRSLRYEKRIHRDEAGELAVCGTVRDVTSEAEALQEAVSAAESLRAIVTALPDTLYRLDESGYVLELPGSTPDEDETGARHLRDFVSPEVTNSVLPLIHHTLAGQGTQSAIVTTSVGRVKRILEARCVPLPNSEVLLLLRELSRTTNAVEEVAEAPNGEPFASQRAGRYSPYTLTDRELGILALVAQGESDRRIGEKLGISTYTVNKHVGNILGKMNAASRTEAGVRALREGLVS